MPPRPPATGRLAERMVWVSISLKVTRPALKPVVPLLAMLLPMTSSCDMLAAIPETPEYNDLNMLDLLVCSRPARREPGSGS